ncbi:hypothetical protein [Rhizobium sp. 007]|uniref:hypothetical protein n=1 Tax=Rhizobium sp. 007 TaxID=2785056 RepID=UPI00189048C6|nr:hypothetical protein [Rhizobium sp. 007]QPB24253.1 hypothetical protein ISN39_32255 [Rhizobium sp. 007]
MRSLTPRAYGAALLRSENEYIDGGSPEYWRQRTEGVRLIREADRALARVERAPMYISGGYDEDGDVIPFENLGPWDARDAAIRAIEADETAVDILVALRRAHFGLWRINAVMGELELAEADHAETPQINPLLEPPTLPVVQVETRPAFRAVRRTLPRLPQTRRKGRAPCAAPSCFGRPLQVHVLSCGARAVSSFGCHRCPLPPVPDIPTPHDDGSLQHLSPNRSGQRAGASARSQTHGL